MGSSFRIARVAGIDVRIHVTFFLVLLFYAWIFYAEGGLGSAVTGVAFVLLLFLCVLLHEFGHAFAARAYGIRTPDITLLPIGGVARLERMPRSPVQELAIAVAGPAVNVLIAAALFPIVAARFGPSDFENFDSAQGGLAGKLLAVNVMLVLFNLLPAFPMDGGRMLRALLAMAIPHARATLFAARVGQVMAVGFAVVGLFGNPFLILIAAFVFMGAQQELESSRLVERLDGQTVDEVMSTRFSTLPRELSGWDLADAVAHDGQRVFPVVDSGLRVLGMVPREAVLEAAGQWPPVRGVPVLPSGMPVMRALGVMQACREPILPVVNFSGQIVGLVSAASLLDRRG